MKLLLFVSCCVLLLREGSLWPYTTTGPGVSLKGKMVTLTQSSGITFYPPQYNPSGHDTTSWDYSATTTTPKTTTTTKTTTTSTTTTPPPTRGVTVCLRFMTDSDSLTLFRFGPGSPLVLTWSPSGFYNFRQSYPGVYLRTHVLLWSSLSPVQSWTSVCLTLDSDKNVVQVFEGGFMSIRKILPTPMLWSGEPVLDVSGFDGHVTDLEVWDYPLEYRQIYSYMQDYGPSGSVLTWSRLRYQFNGRVLLEDSFDRRQRQPIRGEGRVHRFKHKKYFNERKPRTEDRL